MKINITAEVYFNELKLMEQQYGQEEDIYPWIYMLLQMAECKKREVQGVKYNSVSIRDVHDWNKDTPEDAKGVKKEVLNKLREKNGAPDFLVIDKDSNIFGGCVEIKGLSEKNLLGTSVRKTYSMTLKEDECYGIKFNFGTDENEAKEKYKQLKNELGEKEELQDKFEIKELYPGRQKNKGYYFCIVVSSEKISNKLTNEQYNIVYEKKNWKVKYDGTLQWVEENQILSHLMKFAKILYTNGLEFYYLKLIHDSAKNKDFIKVKCLADLTYDYKEYDPNGDNNEELFRRLKSPNGQWSKLIKGLADIDWHKSPTVKITNTEKEKE